jgi:tetratricopeptide (TPR) repeat protein
MKALFLYGLLFLSTIAVSAQNKYVDSLTQWLTDHPDTDTLRVMTTHRLSYRLSEINTTRAWQYAKETESLARKLNFDKGIALANVNYAILETGEGNLKNSADYYMKAIAISERINYPRGMSISYNNIGENYLRLKQFESARIYTEKARNLNKSISEKRGEAINCEQLGNIFYEQGDYDKALSIWNEGYQLAILNNDPNLLALYNINFGKYYLENRNIPKAFRYIQVADSLAKAGSELLLQIQCTKAFAKGYDKQSNHQMAIEQLKKGVIISNELGNKTEECELYNLLSFQFEKIGKPDSGIHYLRMHKLLSDTILSDKNFAHLAFIQTQYETKLKEQENKELKEIQRSQIKKLSEKNLLIVAISVALALALVSVFLFYRSFRHKRIYLQLQEKQKESEYNKALAEMEIKSLRAQMNPHFLFNSLNSIRNYIIKNESKLASEYLANFASLMRKILDASQQSSLSLEEEIEMIKLYMDLERMRFSNKFNFEVKVLNDLDTANLNIPTMAIQPFIENAIWHGLLPKEDHDGKLIIQFRLNELDQDEILCEVIDNGIGRKASENAKSNLKRHQSKGIKITEMRLAQLSKNSESKHIEFVDLTAPDGQSLGTKVIIHLPIM